MAKEKEKNNNLNEMIKQIQELIKKWEKQDETEIEKSETKDEIYQEILRLTTQFTNKHFAGLPGDYPDNPIDFITSICLGITIPELNKKLNADLPAKVDIYIFAQAEMSKFTQELINIREEYFNSLVLRWIDFLLAYPEADIEKFFSEVTSDLEPKLREGLKIQFIGTDQQHGLGKYIQWFIGYIAKIQSLGGSQGKEILKKLQDFFPD